MTRRKQPGPSRGDRRAIIEGRFLGEDLAPVRPKRLRTIGVSEDGEAQSGREQVSNPALVEPERKELPWLTMAVRGLRGKEVAEINLLNTSGMDDHLRFQEVMVDAATTIRIQWRSEEKAFPWTLPELSRNDIRVQFVMHPVVVLADYAVSGSEAISGSEATKGQSARNLSSSHEGKVLLSGELDGSNAALSALVYLIQQEYVSLKPAACSTCGISLCWTHRMATGLRVIISDRAFSNSAIGRKPLLNMAMQKIMSWLRPEIHYLMKRSSEEAIAETCASVSDKKHSFDPAALYDAVKPSCTEQGLDMSFPQLLPELRPYQKRAAFWMVQRERGNGKMMNATECNGGASTSRSAKWNIDAHPLWVTVTPTDGSSEFYYNPLSGDVSLKPDDFVSYVRGGILADEMGLGKTVELLACILANPKMDLPSPSPSEKARKDLEDTLLRRKANRVECACGSIGAEDTLLTGNKWIKCGICDALQHLTCVPTEHSAGRGDKKSDASRKYGGTVSKQVGAPSINGRRVINKGTTGESAKSFLSTENKFVCGACKETIAKVEVEGGSGSTLVVCPTPILRQWQEEILRHTKPGSVRIIVYEGVAKGARLLMSTSSIGKVESSRLKIVSAHDLAGADIVLTTYDTLRLDLFHDADKTKVVQRSLRYLKRYPVIPTPLTRLKWWRICLDEAQMVETTTTRATEMALLLEAENRWCVSGTPIQRGLDDVYGLLKFLQAKPFDDVQHWRGLLQQPYEAGDQWAIAYMHKFLGMIMWRSSKIDVQDELNLPTQEEDVTWLRFSPIDAYFYQQQHEKCALKAREVVNKYGNRIERAQGTFQSQSSSLEESLGDANTPLPMAESTLLSSSLLQLRQACCHPQVGSSGIRTLQQRRPMTMKNILQKLLDQARVTAEEFQRNLIAAWNGLAALAVLDNDIPKAESLYTGVLTLIEKNGAEVNVDPLQKLHTLHNLADISKAPGPTSASTLPVDVLVSKCNEIRSKYMGALVMKSDTEKAKFRHAHEQVAEAEEACDKSGGPNWWLEVLFVIERDDEGEEFVEKIINHFLENAASKHGRVENASSLTHRFRTVAGLKLILQNELDAIQEKRRRVVAKLKELEKMMDNLTVEAAEHHANCKNHSDESGDECAHCTMENLFKEYENRLLLLRTSAGKADGLVSLEDAIFAQQRLAAQRRSRDEILNENEDLYGASGRRTRELNATQAQVIAAPSETEVILSLIKTHARLAGLEQRDAAKKHMQIFENYKREYWQMRKWVTAQRFVLYAFDELHMATLRHRLQVRGEKTETVVEKRVKLHPEELPGKRLQLELDRDEAKQKLLTAEGSLRYLQGLSLRRAEEAQSDQSESFAEKTIDLGAHDLEDETCKICYGKFGSERMILRCGHFFCNTCCMRLMTMACSPADGEEKCIFCPTCRQSTEVKDITLVNDGSDRYTVLSHKGQPSNEIRDREEAELKVVGDYGTKVGAIVRRMLWLKSKDPQAKVLVFSTWQDVLDVVGHALTVNNIRFARVKNSNLDKAVEEFKAPSDEHVQALLLQFHRGGNGLNLVEAQHVLLVEPLPNTGIEAQAINRIHRIGQRRATFVHRFIVKDTVEERIFELGRRKVILENLDPSKKWAQKTLTLHDVSALFAPNIIGEESPEPQEDPQVVGTFRNISPAAAAGAAAEARRLASLSSQQIGRT